MTYAERRNEILREIVAAKQEYGIVVANLVADYANDKYEQVEFAYKNSQIPETDQLIYFSPRGVGAGWYSCLICGHEGGQADMASFVSSRANGLLAVQWFEDAGLTAHLDYRDHEPNWVQVKVGACAKHEGTLTLLENLVGPECILDPTVPFALKVSVNE